MDYKRSSEWGNRKGRLMTMARNNLGVINKSFSAVEIYRNQKLHILDSYYTSTQYDKLFPFDDDCTSTGEHIPLRKRKPRMNFAFAKTLSQKVTSKLIGKRVFPNIKIEDSPMDEEFFKAILETSKLRTHLLEPIRKCLAVGSVFVRFNVASGVFKFEHFDSKSCYPEFQSNGELEKVVVKYVYTDSTDLDSNGNPKRKWYKLELNTQSEILYDNPEYNPNVKEEPTFKVVSQVDHGFGFVQGEWINTTGVNDSKNFDGYSLIEDILDFIDELNYSISQSSRAISYNQDPQLFFKGMMDEEVNNVVRSSAKSWVLGREGEAGFLESNLTGVDKALDLRDKIKTHISDITRILLLDPEKAVANAQSAKAMEVLYEPLLDLVDELREPFGEVIKKILLKLGIMAILCKQIGVDSPIVMPEGYSISSFDLKLNWPEVFQLTIEDLQKKISLASSAHNARLISRFTAMRYIQDIFGIQDIESEAKLIDQEPVFNPFGGF